MYLPMANDGGSRLRERRCFAAMAAWVDVVRERAGGALLWEEGLQFGDWLDPDAPPDRPGDAKTDAGIVATAYFHRSAALTAKAAALLGRDADARRYGDLAARVTDAFRAAYVTPRGRMMSDAPTAYALALVFGLAPDGQRQALGDRYALGGVADWLHRRVAGLAALEPGYRLVHVSPTLLDDLDDASAWRETPYGPARAGWRREGARVHFHAEIPPNTRAWWSCRPVPGMRWGDTLLGGVVEPVAWAAL
ncbi:MULTISPECIES: alpha-L-rhamnosidase C-terminal domain-containing protein [Streptomyces]|uniref:alpha-L-rhamnosidase-related protein n=2 Tax=Streptomyces TaxID=1883 RepID=UPI0006EB9FFB|nr:MULTISPECIES: alpha-L-rhamnosidase C-terminal domain-containing protein [Streptomyces]